MLTNTFLSSGVIVFIFFLHIGNILLLQNKGHSLQFFIVLLSWSISYFPYFILMDLSQFLFNISWSFRERTPTPIAKVTIFYIFVFDIGLKLINKKSNIMALLLIYVYTWLKDTHVTPNLSSFANMTHRPLSKCHTWTLPHRPAPVTLQAKFAFSHFKYHLFPWVSFWYLKLTNLQKQNHLHYYLYSLSGMWLPITVTRKA